jgi:copper homeostasis protein (lipoprotein)
MTRNIRIPVSLCMLLAVVALAGCRREDAAAPAVAPPTTVAPASVATVASPATVAAPLGVATSAAPGEHTDFDAKAFAGTFAAPGTRISFDADGNYTMRVHAESANADLDTQGTWTLEPDGRHILLDPSSKAESDRRYEVASMDELRPDDGGAGLHREGTH